MFRKSIIAGTLAALLPMAASAVTYTYDLNFTYSALREAGLGAYADPRAGSGGFTGMLAIDEAMNIISYEITSRNTTTSYASETSYIYASSDANDSGSVQGPIIGRPGVRNTLTFYDGASLVTAAEGRTVPTGAFRAGWRYTVPGAYMRLFVHSGFTPGDSSLTFAANEIFGVAHALAPAGFKTDLGFEHVTYGFATGGALRTSGGTGGGGTGAEPSPVPLPAGGALLVAALAGLAGLKRRRAQRG